MSLLHAIEICLSLTNEPPSRFGRRSARDPRLVHDLRRGREPGPALRRRVMAYISSEMERLPEPAAPATERGSDAGAARGRTQRRMAALARRESGARP
jgi:hypothetical protein